MAWSNIKTLYICRIRNHTLNRYILPVKLNQRIVYAEVDSEEANPRSIFDFPDDHIAKKEALEAYQHISERIYS